MIKLILFKSYVSDLGMSIDTPKKRNVCNFLLPIKVKKKIKYGQSRKKGKISICILCQLRLKLCSDAKHHNEILLKK